MSLKAQVVPRIRVLHSRSWQGISLCPITLDRRRLLHVSICPIPCIMGLSLREVRRPVDLLEGQHVILSSGSKDRPAKRVDLKPFEETLNTLRDYDGPDEAFPAEQALQPRLHAKSPHLKAYFAYLDKELDHHDPCWCGYVLYSQLPGLV